MATREESDSIGLMEVPQKAYYGVQSLRAKNNSTLQEGRFIRSLLRIWQGSRRRLHLPI